MNTEESIKGFIVEQDSLDIDWSIMKKKSKKKSKKVASIESVDTMTGTEANGIKLAESKALEVVIPNQELVEIAPYDYGKLLKSAIGQGVEKGDVNNLTREALAVKGVITKFEIYERPTFDLKIEKRGRETKIENFESICRIVNRDSNHMFDYMIAELNTTGSITDNKLVIQGKFSKIYINAIIKKYISEYVKCRTKMCASYKTILTHDSVLRRKILECTKCRSRISVAPIKKPYCAETRASRQASRATS
jgi:translation initiation factor 2 subunit 2